FGVTSPYDQVGNVTVFNAPGFWDTALNRNFFATWDSIVPNEISAANVTNVVANETSVGEAPFRGVAKLHSRPGKPIDISIEDQTALEEPDSFGALNHSIVALTDTLAVYDLLSRVDPTLTTAAYHQILEQAVIGTAAGYERIVDGLQKLLGIDYADLPYGNNNRDALYSAIYDLQEHDGFQALAGAKIGTLPTAQQAKEDFGAFLALDFLTPFYIEGRSSKLGGIHDERYALWQVDQALTAEQRKSGQANFSDAWFADRAAMLAWRLQMQTEDNPNWLPVSGIPVNYVDNATGLTAPGPIATQNLPLQQQVIFGSGAGETIEGKGRDDRLYGGAGDDTINGAGGDDYIEGNDGDDVIDGGS